MALPKQQPEVAGMEDIPQEAQAPVEGDGQGQDGYDGQDEQQAPPRPRFRTGQVQGGQGGFRPQGRPQAQQARFGGSGGGFNRGGFGRQQGQAESKYVRVAGLWPTEQGGLSGKIAQEVYAQTELGEVFVAAGVKFYIFENNYRQKNTDPHYYLMFSKFAPQQRGGGAPRRFGRG